MEQEAHNIILTITAWKDDDPKRKHWRPLFLSNMPGLTKAQLLKTALDPGRHDETIPHLLPTKARVSNFFLHEVPLLAALFKFFAFAFRPKMMAKWELQATSKEKQKTDWYEMYLDAMCTPVDWDHMLTDADEKNARANRKAERLKAAQFGFKLLVLIQQKRNKWPLKAADYYKVSTFCFKAKEMRLTLRPRSLTHPPSSVSVTPQTMPSQRASSS